MGVHQMSYDRVRQFKSRLIIGKRQTVRAMKNNQLTEVFIARNADEHVTSQVAQLANELNIPCTYVDSKEELGSACGIDVSTSTVGIKQE